MTVGALKWYNFWSRRNGALYGFRSVHPTTGRVIFAYGGKTFQEWTTRGEQHMWGGGRYASTAQPWADTVLGWRPNGTIDEIIDAGGFFLIRKPRKISPFGLWWREIVFAIWLRRPYYNYQWNQGNHRRIPKFVAVQQREARERGERYSGAGAVRRSVALTISGVVLAGIVALLIPGMPAGGLTVDAWDLVAYHRDQLGVGLVAVGVAGLATTWVRPRRLRSGSRARSPRVRATRKVKR